MRGLFDRIFFDFTLTRARLTLFRIVFFFLVGVDAFLQIEHAPRYGAGDFNVAHFTWIDALLPLPGREAMMVMYVVQAYLAFRVMAGVTVRPSLAILTALYGFTYFVSQVDSYQHHYLMFLLLFLANLWPWDAAARASSPNEPVKAWAVRVTTVQVSILYLWTAIAKMDPDWFNGITFRMQISDRTLRDALSALAGQLGVETLSLFAALSIAVCVGELLLSVGWQVRRLWPVVVPLGWSFHMGVEYAGFKIGLFSYFMVALYALVLPEAWLTAPARFFARGKNQPSAAPKRARKKKKGQKGDEGDDAPAEPAQTWPLIKGGGMELASAVAAAAVITGALAVIVPHSDRLSWMALLVASGFVLSVALQYYPTRWLTDLSGAVGQGLGIAGDGSRTWAFLVVAVLAGSGVLWIMPFSEAGWYVAAIALLGLGLDVQGGAGRLQRAMVHVLVCAMLLGCHLTTDQALNYYRYMGGDARRRGDLKTAVASYKQVTIIDPSYEFGFKRLGDLYMRTKDFPKAVDAYREAARLKPGDPSFGVLLARALAAAGQGDEAQALAKELLERPLKDEDKAQLQRILSHSGGGSDDGEDGSEGDDGDE